MLSVEATQLTPADQDPLVDEEMPQGAKGILPSFVCFNIDQSAIAIIRKRLEKDQQPVR